MSTGDIFSLLVFIAAAGGYYFFILRGRAYGYQALATRVSQLHEEGVNKVWLMYGNKGVGYDINLSHASIWTLLNTGFLAYLTGNQLTIEFPWWNNMRPLLTVPLTQVKAAPTTVTYARREYRAVSIGYQSYVILALNIEDAKTIKDLLKLRPNIDGNALRADFMSALAAAQPAASDILHVPPPAPSPTLSAWKIIRGTFLYVLLPCLALTAAVLLWAILTKQPAFR